LAVLAGSYTEVAGTEAVASSVRGVAPEEQVKYASSAAVATFRCFADEALELGARAAAPLPFSVVNDDFCDCSDGSDEPGTSACAGQKDTMFYCPNQHSVATFIYTSHVNDGICDCCDGADEWRTAGAGACPNTCEEEGAVFRKILQQKEAAWRAGAAKRQVLIDGAKQAGADAVKELSQLRENLPTLEAEEDAMRAAFEEAKFAHEQEQQSLSNATTDPGQESLAAVASEAPVMATEVAAESQAAAATEPVVETAADDFHETGNGDIGLGLGGVAKASDGNKEGPAAEGGAAVSEYTKWMDGAEKVLETTTPEPEAAAELEESLVNEEDPSLFERFRAWIGKSWENIFGKAMTPLERAHDVAAKAHETTKKKVKDARKQLDELQRKVDDNLGEDQGRLAYSALDGKCLSMKFEEYKYEACFFKDAKQDSTSVGNWKHWESTHVGIFDGGQYCHGGPDRSLRVKFQCGPDEEILEVSEPSRCAYEAKISHPAACVGVAPSEASMGKARLPTEEL